MTWTKITEMLITKFSIVVLFCVDFFRGQYCNKGLEILAKIALMLKSTNE